MVGFFMALLFDCPAAVKNPAARLAGRRVVDCNARLV
jgi:hypothetical protein